MNSTIPPELIPPGAPPSKKLNWWLFCTALFTPTLLTILANLLGATRGDTAPSVAFIGGGLSGIICGVLLGRRIGSNSASRFVLGVVFAIMVGAACIVMNCFGCLAAGYNFTM
jgi:hypothetical protein